MALVAVRVAVLGVEVGDLRVAERERIALVVVVRLVLRIRVERLELHVVRRALGHAERDAVIEALRRRLDDGQRADAVPAARAEAVAPRTAGERAARRRAVR